MEVIIGIYIFILGTIFASFFGVIIDRTPRGVSIVSPVSQCDYCGHKLKWYENIPVFSYLFLKGRCSACKTKIEKFLFVYEIIGGLSTLFVYVKYGLTYECLIIELIVLMMLLIGGYDYKTNTILNVFLYILGLLCIGLFGYRVFVLKKLYLDYIFGSLLGLIFFLAVKLIMSKILKKDALGSGDVILVTIMGICFGPFEQLLSILIASIIGSVIALVSLKLNKIYRDEEIAFCPYLCFGYYVIFIFGNILTRILVG